MRYFDITARSNHRLELPFLSLERSLTNDPSLHFVSIYVLMPPDVNFDQDLIQQYEKELQFVNSLPLHDVDNYFLVKINGFFHLKISSFGKFISAHKPEIINI